MFSCFSIKIRRLWLNFLVIEDVQTTFFITCSVIRHYDLVCHLSPYHHLGCECFLTCTTLWFLFPTNCTFTKEVERHVKLLIALEASWPKQTRDQGFWPEFTQQWSKCLVKWFKALIFLSFSMVHTDWATYKVNLNGLSLIFNKHLHHVTEKIPLIAWRQEQRTFLSKRLKTFLAYPKRWVDCSLLSQKKGGLRKGSLERCQNLFFLYNFLRNKIFSVIIFKVHDRLVCKLLIIILSSDHDEMGWLNF